MPQHRPVTKSRSFGSFLLAAGLLAFASDAIAQGEPAPAPAPAADPPPPAAAPAPAPAPAEGGFTASFGTGAAPLADTTTSPPPPPAEGEPKPLPWRGTTLTWNQAATTTAVGVGRDNIGSEDEYYGWELVLFPNLYVVDEEYHKLTVFAEAGVAVEWTDSSDTTTENEPYFKDLQVGTAYSPTFWQSDDKEWKTGGSLRLRLIFPTSPISNAQGRILTTSLGAGLNQKVKLLGKDAEGLNNLTVRAGVSWSHLFSNAFTPTNPDLRRQRQNASGQTIDSDQLTTNSFDVDRVIPSLGFDLPIFGDLSLSTNFRLIGRFKRDFEGDGTGCDVVTATGCVDASGDDASVPFDNQTYLVNTGFDASLSYPVFDIVHIALGYYNETLGLAPNGERRDIFYSPDAQFFMDVEVHLDAIYEKATKRGEPPGGHHAPRASAAPLTGPSF